MKKIFIVIVSIVLSGCQSEINLETKCDCFNTFYLRAVELMEDEGFKVEKEDFRLLIENIEVKTYLAFEKIKDDKGLDYVLAKCFPDASKNNYYKLSNPEEMRKAGNEMLESLGNECKKENEEKSALLMDEMLEKFKSFQID
jgi:hypothetical protein